VPDELDPEMIAALSTLAETVADRDDHGDIAAKLEWLIEALIMRGQLPPTYRRLVTKIHATGDRNVVRLATFRDKYAIESAAIDCASRIPLCGARCCSFEVTLSAQDLAERELPFDITQPYALPRSDGRCVCMAADGSCAVYERRPGACRAYDCRHDPRVWLDFEQRIPAPR